MAVYIMSIFLSKTDCISIIINIFAVELQKMAFCAIFAN